MVSWWTGHVESQILYPIFSGLILALMVIVTSPLNNLDYIKGGKEAGRTTIPIILGSKNTIRLSLFIKFGIAFSTWGSVRNFTFTWHRQFDCSIDGISFYAITLPILVSGNAF